MRFRHSALITDTFLRVRSFLPPTSRALATIAMSSLPSLIPKTARPCY
jgi:hypothetical protein